MSNAAARTAALEACTGGETDTVPTEPEYLATALHSSRMLIDGLQRDVAEANARAADAEREAIVESVHADMRHRAQALEHAHRIADGTLDVAEILTLADWILGGDR